MKKKQILLLFLQVLVKEAVEAGFFMRRIILVKYLYLLDVYMAQETGHKFTDINWIFWKFGPYSNDANDFVDELLRLRLVKEKVTETRYETDLIQYEPIDLTVSRKDIWRFLPPKVLNKIFNIDLKRFADDTYKLLDYVYFDTEPMQNVHMRDVLKFDNLVKDLEKEPIELKPISKTKFNKVKKMLTQHKSISAEKLFPTFDDALLNEFDKTFFNEELSEFGPCKVVFK